MTRKIWVGLFCLGVAGHDCLGEVCGIRIGLRCAGLAHLLFGGQTLAELSSHRLRELQASISCFAPTFLPTQRERSGSG